MLKHEQRTALKPASYFLKNNRIIWENKQGARRGGRRSKSGRPGGVLRARRPALLGGIEKARWVGRKDGKDKKDTRHEQPWELRG